MSKKIVAASAAVFFLSGLAATWYTNARYDEYIESNIELARQQHGSEGMVLSYDRVFNSMFNREDVITVSMTAEELANNNADGFAEGLEIKVINYCKVLPLYLDCTLEFASDNEQIKELQAMVSGFEYDVSWQMNYWLNSNKGYLKTSEFTVSDTESGPNDAFTVAASEITYQGDALLNELSFTGEWLGMQLTEGNGGTFKVDNAVFSGNLEKIGDLYLKGDSEMTVNGIALNDEFSAFSLNSLAVSSNTVEASENKLDIDYQIQADKILHHDKTAENQKFDIKDVNLALALKAIPVETFELFNQISQVKEQSEVLDILAKMGKSPFKMEVSSLTATVNNVVLDSSGTLNLTEFSAQDLQVPRGLVNKFFANMSFSMTKNIVTEFTHYAPMVEQFTQQNLLILDKDGNYQSKLDIEQGMLKINQIPVQQLF